MTTPSGQEPVAAAEAQEPPRYRVVFVCTGNTCRSPIAEVVLRRALEREDLGGVVSVASAGTDGWQTGSAADERAVAVLAAHGYDACSHRARSLDRSSIRRTDLVVALDSGHQEVLRRWAGDDDQPERIRLLRSFDPAAVAKGKLDVKDPYYGGRKKFEKVLAQTERAMPGIVEHIRTGLASRSEPA